MSSQFYRRRRAAWLCAVLSFSPLLCHARLTVEQKLHDFQQLVALYERYYVPAAWKKQISGFDLSDERPWLARVASSRDDLEFVELCAEYVASLNDSHSAYRLVRNEWKATLGFEVGLYKDGESEKVLIDRIDRARMPAAQYPFQIGDELVSFDGVSADAWVERLVMWAHGSNPRARRSTAAMGIVYRQQTGGGPIGGFPRAPLETPDNSNIVVRRANGNLETFTVQWQKSGTPVLEFGPVTDGLFSRTTSHEPRLTPLDLKASAAIPGQLAPVLALPAGFQQRLGSNRPPDPFFTGTFSAEGLKIGYLRIPAFSPGQQNLAKLAAEIAFFNANTDALIVDVMHNSGGAGDYADQIFSFLSPVPYREVMAVWRPSLTVMGDLVGAIEQIRIIDPPKAVLLEAQLEQLRLAYERGDALTAPMPASIVQNPGLPAKDPQGNILAYTKPIMLLTDEWSISAADAFASMFQDNHRGIVFGTRTNGAGGAVASFLTGNYAQAETGVELNLTYRHQTVNVPGYPATRFVDNVGVHPDIVEDITTRENLMNGGATFSQRMVAAIAQYVRQSRQ